MRDKKLNWRVNEEIRATELRVIGEDGKQIGVLSREDALAQAKERGVDIVEIAPTAKPPVAKIIDFDKFRYSEEKKAKKQKRVKAGELKEIRFSPFIAEGDYKTRIARINQFLADNNKIRVVVVFKGRQMDSKKFGYEIFDKVLSLLGDSVSVDMPPKFFGRHLAMVISPNKKSRKQGSNAETENKESNNEKV